MNQIKDAFNEFKDAVLMALDDAYSDGMNMDKAFIEIKDYVNASDCGDMTYTLEGIYDEWKKDCLAPENVYAGDF